MRRNGLAVWRPLLLAAIICVPAHAGKPGPYLFMYGLRGFGDGPKTARALGLNTLYLDLPPDAPDQIADIKEEARAAKRAGLVVIIGLPTTLTDGYTRSPYNTPYVRAVTEWITATVTGLKDVPNLVGWGTGHDLETCISYTDDDFRTYLHGIYGSLEDLNASWGKQVLTWSSVSMALTDAVDLGQPFDVGRATVDLADYKRGTYSQLMSLWAQAIRAADPQPSHWLFTGRILLYRSLMSVPDGYNVVCPSAPIDGLERDIRTQNVHAVDMARRGGKFGAIPTIRFALPPSPLYREDVLRAWIREAGLHGAMGIGLQDFDRLNTLTRFDDAVKHIGDDVRSCLKGATFTCEPKPSIAFLYEPYAAGALVGAQPMYGHIIRLIEGEPENPYYAFRTGTVFGPADFIALEDLPLKDLSGYGTVIAPMALRIPDPVGKQLTDYALNGGTLLADIGLGMYEAGTWKHPPASMAKLFDGVNLENLKALVGDLTAGAANRFFPSLVPGTTAAGSFVVTAKGGGTVGGKRYAISGWSGETLVPPGASVIAHFNHTLGKDKRLRVSGVLGFPANAGLAVLATHRLWAYWVPDDPMYEAFHFDLCGRGARGQVLGEGFWGKEVQVSFGEQSAYLLNTTNRALSARVAMFGTCDRAYTGALTSFTSALHDISGRRAGTVVLTVDLPPQWITECHSLPLAVQPYEGAAHVLMGEYSAQQVVFRIAGNGADINTRRNATEVFTPADVTRVRITLTSGVYPVPPGSRHQVTFVPDKGDPLTDTLTADDEGHLQFSQDITRATVTIKPAG